MKHFYLKLASLTLLFIINITQCVVPSYWQAISLPDVYIAPGKNDFRVNGTLTNANTMDKYEPKISNKPGSYSLKFPTEKMSWFQDDSNCLSVRGKNAYASTQTRIRSEKISSISGLSFLGNIQGKHVGSSPENHYAIFFHSQKCYDGGPEYGFAFYENMKTALFYICNECNLTNQTWWDWPGKDGSQIGNENVNDPENAVATALGDPSQERYWEIQIEPNGDFIVTVKNPQTWATSVATIKKPANFPNLYKKAGYITVNAKRNDDSTANMGTLNLKEVKVWQ